MYAATIIASIASLATVATAAATPEVVKRQTTNERVRDHCSRAGGSGQEGFRFAYVWSEHGTFGPGGSPEIGNTGNVWILNKPCEILGLEGWEGNTGALSVFIDTELTQGWELAVTMQGNVLTEIHNRPSPPTGISFRIDGEEYATPGNNMEWSCDDGFSENIGLVVAYWRFCYMNIL